MNKFIKLMMIRSKLNKNGTKRTCGKNKKNTKSNKRKSSSVFYYKVFCILILCLGGCTTWCGIIGNEVLFCFFRFLFEDKNCATEKLKDGVENPEEKDESAGIDESLYHPDGTLKKTNKKKVVKPERVHYRSIGEMQKKEEERKNKRLKRRRICFGDE